MVEITAREQNKGKGMKRIEESLRDLWDNIKQPVFELQGSQRKKKKQKGTEKIFEEIIVESPTWERKQSIKFKKHRESHRG